MPCVSAFTPSMAVSADWNMHHRWFVRRFRQTRRDARVAEGAPLLREYRVYSSIEGSNPSLSANSKDKPMTSWFRLCLLSIG